MSSWGFHVALLVLFTVLDATSSGRENAIGEPHAMLFRSDKQSVAKLFCKNNDARLLQVYFWNRVKHNYICNFSNPLQYFNF